MSAKTAVGILILLFCGCKDQISQPSPLDPYMRWRSNGLHNYSIDQVRLCYCVMGGQTMRITVRSDTIESVRNLSDSSIVSFPISSYYRTVDSLFAVIRNPGTDSLVITYNETYGYPETLDINPQLHPVDGGVLYQTSNLHIP